jgi:hypothetical protein
MLGNTTVAYPDVITCGARVGCYIMNNAGPRLVKSLQAAVHNTLGLCSIEYIVALCELLLEREPKRTIAAVHKPLNFTSTERI